MNSRADIRQAGSSVSESLTNSDLRPGTLSIS